MKSGCPTPNHCHRSPRCVDGCEDSEAVANYQATLIAGHEAKIAEHKKAIREIRQRMARTAKAGAQ